MQIKSLTVKINMFKPHLEEFKLEHHNPPLFLPLLLPHSLTANFTPYLLPPCIKYFLVLCVCVRVRVCLHAHVSQVCKEAKAELVFLVDGSWSIGDDNFLKITRFLASTVGSLDLIGADGTQVGHMTTASTTQGFCEMTLSLCRSSKREGDVTSDP